MFICIQKILPQHLLSRWLGWLTHCRCSFFKNKAIHYFIRHFKVDLSESLVTDIRQFPSFNDFFIRQLKPNARPLPHDPTAIACPADGILTEFGKIQAGRLLQAKGRYYELIDLLGGHAEMAQHFLNGNFFTVYLAPKDYHRVHMPITGQLHNMIHIPGRLFSVNMPSVMGIPRLFARNERVVCLFETAAGMMAVIFIGALLIGSVVTPWHGQVMPTPHSKSALRVEENSPIILQRGDEVGYFQWGSTVIVLFGENAVNWQTTLYPGDAVRIGQCVGSNVTVQGI